MKLDKDKEVLVISGRENAHPKEISDLIKKSKTIKKITLDFYGLDDDELTMICKSLRENHSLNELNIHVQNYDSWHPSSLYGAIRGDGALALAETIRVNTSLRKISLLQDLKGISSESAVVFTSAVCQNQNMKALHLRINGRNKIHDIMAPFKSNKTLSELYLNFYPGLSYAPFLTETDIQCIIDSLRLDQDDCSLVTLGLGCNGITAQTLKPLIKSLKSNTSLRELDLKGNLIGDEGALLLIELLATNHNLQEIQYLPNKIAKENLQQIKQLLGYNQRLSSKETFKAVEPSLQPEPLKGQIPQEQLQDRFRLFQNSVDNQLRQKLLDEIQHFQFGKK